jgi:hypothetical protein
VRCEPLGRTRPTIRTREALDRWTWLVIAAHTNSTWLAYSLPTFAGLGTTRPNRPLTPTRARHSSRNIRPKTALPANAPKPDRPGPGRQTGTRSHQPAPSYNVGKTDKRDRTITARRRSPTGG